jgi:hypothetical protein
MNEKGINNKENVNINYKSQYQMDIQSLIDMCSIKLDKEPNHKKALLLRASSYIKKNELERVYYLLFIIYIILSRQQSM